MSEGCLGGRLPAEWWKDKQLFLRELTAHNHNSAEVQRAHPEISARRVREIRRLLTVNTPSKADAPKEIDPPGVTIEGDRARVTSEPSPQLGDVDTVLRDRGLNPDEWDVERVKVNEWEAYAGRDKDSDEPRVVKLHQLTVHLKRKVTWDFLLPASTDVAGKLFAPPKQAVRAGCPRLVWVGGDQQAPYHDELLHEAVCLWLRDVQPDEMCLLGDTTDMPTISRHDDRPHWNASPQACVDAAYVMLHDYCSAAPDARKRKLRGNHDWRIESEMLKRAERMFGLRPAKLPDEAEQPPLYSIRRLLRLDELQIELVGRDGDKWELAEIEVAPDLVVRHQPPSEKTMVRVNRSVIAGHTHSQRVQPVTVRHTSGEWVTRTLVEAGTLSRLDLGYARDVNWQQGFATAAIFDDGSLAFDLATWDGRRLMWRGETWKP